MKTKTLKSKAIYSLSALFVAVLMFVIAITLGSLRASADTNFIVLFDGTNASATIPAENTNVEGIKLNIVGMSEMTNITNGFTLDGSIYYKAIKTGGSPSETRYFSFTVPETIKQFIVKIVAAPNGSTAVKFGLSTSISKVADDSEAFFTTGSSSSTYTAGTSGIQTVTTQTTYYLNFSASARIAHVVILPTAEGVVVPGDTSSSTVTDSSTTTTDSSSQKDSSTNSSVVTGNSSLSSYSGTSSGNNNTNKADTTTNKGNIIVALQILLGVLLIVLIIVGIISIVRKNKRKGDWFDYDDFDNFDDFDE